MEHFRIALRWVTRESHAALRPGDTHPASKISKENTQMRKFASGLIAAVLLTAICIAAPADKTYTGQIMDNECAQMGSHESMMKKEGTKDAKDCALACIKGGGKYVLYNSATKKTYQLDDQMKPEQFAGQKVTVTGSYDSAAQAIHVTDIQSA